MAIHLLNDRGVSIEKQKFTWKELVQSPISKLDSDAFSRVRVILMNGIEAEALRFSHSFARKNRALQVPLAHVRRIEQHQATLVNGLLGADHSPLETTIAYEQVAIEVTAAVAQREPDPYLAQVYRFGLLEDFDHLYRFSALMDRVDGKDPNQILQSYTDILPGRPTQYEHRSPEDDVRESYDRLKADPLSRFHALTILSMEQQAHNYYMNIGPIFADPIARLLYAEIASIEEQHVTQYESLMDPDETWMEKWLLHEANEVYNYHSCVESESDPRVKALWERMLDYELGHLALVRDLFKSVEGRDPAEILPTTLPASIDYRSQREFVRGVLEREVGLRALGAQIVPQEQEGAASRDYRDQLNSEGDPSERVAEGYCWEPGTELAIERPRKAA